jgi:hypothetical protein
MSADQREQLLKAADRVNRIRQDLIEAERELDALLSGSSSKTAKGFPQRGSTVNGSLPSKIMERMNREPNKSFVAEDFQNLAAGKNALQYVRSCLYRLVKAKKLKKNGRGHFKLKLVNGAAEHEAAT